MLVVIVNLFFIACENKTIQTHKIDTFADLCTVKISERRVAVHH